MLSPSTVSSLNDSAETPSISLANEAAELGVLKVGRDDLALKFAGAEDAPGAAMRQPANDIFKRRVIEDHVHLDRKVVCSLEGTERLGRRIGVCLAGKVPAVEEGVRAQDTYFSGGIGIEGCLLSDPAPGE